MFEKTTIGIYYIEIQEDGFRRALVNITVDGVELGDYNGILGGPAETVTNLVNLIIVNSKEVEGPKEPQILDFSA